MHATIKAIEHDDIILEIGERYRPTDSTGRTALSSLHAGDSVEIRKDGIDTIMRAFGGKEFKVRRS